jgi:hypothetical protein
VRFRAPLQPLSVYPDAKFAGKIIHCSNGRFKLELSFRNQITNSPSNDLKAEYVWNCRFCFKTTKGIYDGRGEMRL